MRTYEQFVELAKLSAHHARTTLDKRTAGEFWRMAYEYLNKAVQLTPVGPSAVPLFSQNLAEALSIERERHIRELAYTIWEREGRPEGEGLRHWLTAEIALDGVEGALIALLAGGERRFH